MKSTFFFGLKTANGGHHQKAMTKVRLTLNMANTDIVQCVECMMFSHSASVVGVFVISAFILGSSLTDKIAAFKGVHPNAKEG